MRGAGGTCPTRLEGSLAEVSEVSFDSDCIKKLNYHRNEAWRYEPKQFGTHSARLNTFLFRGIGIGFAAFLVTIGVEYALGIGKGQGGHGHGHGHGDEHGHGDKEH